MCEALRELMNDEIEEEQRIAGEEAIKVAKAEREVKKTAKETVLTNIRSLTRTSRNQNFAKMCKISLLSA